MLRWEVEECESPCSLGVGQLGPELGEVLHGRGLGLRQPGAVLRLRGV
jgi:hypothetical protein